MSEKGIMSGYQALALAIVEQAVLDYADAAERQYFGDDMTLLKRQDVSMKEIKDFFHSDWFAVLSDMDGDRLLAGAQEMARRNIRKRLDKEKNAVAMKIVIGAEMR